MTFAFARFRIAVPFKFWLVASSALVSWYITAPDSALAQSCDPVPNGGQLNGVNPSTVCTGPFNTNINFGGLTSPPTTLQTVTLSNAQVLIPAGLGPDAVNIDNSGGGPIAGTGSSAALTANNSSVDNTANSGAGSPSGLRIQTNGNATITATNTPIAVTGAGNANGIWAIVLPSSDPTTAAKVSYTGPTTNTGPDITVSGGANSTAIQAENRGSGNASIDAAGDFTVVKPTDSSFFVFGLLAKSGAPGGIGRDASVSYSSGTIQVSGVVPVGIQASSQGDGSATVNAAAGTVINLSSTQFGGEGVLVLSSGTAANGRAITANVASRIVSSGPASIDPNNFPNGILALGYRDAPILVNYTGPGITTSGGNGAGIYAFSGGGTITINSTGPIDTTDGSNAIGIFADSAGGAGRSSKLVTEPGTIIIGPQAAQATVTVNATDVLTMGEFGTAISATAGGNVAVNVSGSVMGGWQDDLTSVGTVSSLPAAGVVLGSSNGSATLTNIGAIGALSDRAVASADLYSSGFSGDVNIINNGTITGFVTLSSGDDTFTNLTPNSFDIRNFADTNGDGIRDTKGVAISDFGAGNDQFVNGADGVVRLLPVTGAAVTNATGYYVPTTGLDSRPLEASFYDLNREGVVQGQLVNLETFSNAGTIDLRNAPVGGTSAVVGNTLVITGNATAGGPPGTGLYVSNGGRLLVNTELNGGIPAGGQTNSYSDMLIVDRTQVGTGATAIGVTNVGGNGALTPGNGIELVEVRDKAGSDPAAFTLAGDYVTKQGQQAVVGGAYAYTLNYGGVGADSADGNWYLRSQLTPGPTPDPLVPLFQAGDPVYEIYPQILLDLNDLPTMQQRVGNSYWTEPTVPEEVFCKDPAQNFQCKISSKQASYYLGSQPVTETNGIWTRIDGLHGHFEPRVTSTGTDYDNNIWRLQAGLDGLLYETGDGNRLIGGINVHYGQASASATSIYGDGGIDTDGYGLGGTLTWLAQNGFYADGQASVTWFDSDLSSDTAGRNLADGNNGFGYALSVETGKRFDLNEAWTITPQAQLAYSNVDFDDFTDPFGAHVSSNNSDSLVGRLGVSVNKEATWDDDADRTRRGNVYGITNLYYEFLNASQVDVSGTEFENGPERLWGGVGIGGSYNWNGDKYSVYAEVSVNTSLESFGDSYALNGTAGFRVRW